jgi:predicted site-specific integrase-resolvase
VIIIYSIGEFSKIINRSVKTLQRWDRENILKAKRHSSNRRYYTEQQLLEYKGVISSEKSLNVAYCRVSSNNQKDDLKNQKEFISNFCLNSGISIDEWVFDIGSGLNYNRKNFNKLMSSVENGKIKKIIIAHKDRLIRFGYIWFERFCLNHGAEVIVINNDLLSPEQEIIQDLINIIHVFSCRIYGLRKYKNEISKENKIKSK